MESLRSSIGALVLLVFATAPAQASAETCSTLAMLTEDRGAFQRLGIEVEGSLPLAMTALAAGLTPGETILETGFGILTVGLDRPFAIRRIGVTDPDGNLSSSLLAPNDLGIELHAQAISILVVPGRELIVEACTSNVATVSL